MIDTDVRVESPLERPRRRGRRLLKAFGVLVVLVLLVAGAAGWWFLRQVDPPGPPGREVQVTIAHGTSGQRIAALLDDKGVIESARVFRVYMRLKNAGGFQAGEYTFRKRQHYDGVIAALRDGPDIAYERLIVREGLTLGQIAAEVGKLPGRSAETFLGIAASGQVRSQFQPPEVASLEGFLFPETYLVAPNEDEAAILRRLVTQFDRVATAAGIGEEEAKVGLTPYEAIITASLIERETRFDDERPMVSRVIFNRLERNQALQIDATIIYALGKSAESNVRVLNADLEVDSPFNTYRNLGLPPGPIAAPSRDSLEATLAPDEGDWLFYVVTETNGRHSFATTGAEHQANIAKARRNGVR